ncbi:MAG: ActS/PrrB/RegB family redox-sensitive histidine kinase [Pseudomonadota bacterium]
MVTKLLPAGQSAASKPRSQSVRLRTLTMLRWMGVIGQATAVIGAALFLDLNIPIGYCSIAIGASILFNLLTTFLMPPSTRLSERAAFMSQLFDLYQLTILLFLTGGLNNPFSLLFLAPITIAATVMSLKLTIILGCWGIFLATTLIFGHLPLTTHTGEIVAMPLLILWGMWAAIVIGIIFVAGYARQIAMETFSMSQALTATQLALAREQQLTALGGVVAAAAHEMGTPLATIKLTSSELVEDLSDRPQLAEDAALIREQAERLGTILKDMGESGRDDLHTKSAPLVAVIEEAAAPHMDRGKDLVLTFNGSESYQGMKDIPVIPRSPEIMHGLRNLIQNAIDFGQSRAEVRTDWGDRRIRVIVQDDGRGYPTDLLGRIGEPFVSQQRYRTEIDLERPAYEGMGLGLFIAKTLLERSGAALSFINVENSKSQPSGALVSVVWDRALLEAASPRAYGVNPQWRN